MGFWIYSYFILNQKGEEEVKKISLFMTVIILCFGLISCGGNSADYENGTSDIFFGDISMSIPTTWIYDETVSDDENAYYKKYDGEQTDSNVVSMLYLCRIDNTTADDYLKSLVTIAGVSNMSPLKDYAVEGTIDTEISAPFVTYNQEINSTSHEMKTYAIETQSGLIGITFGTTISNESDFTQSINSMLVSQNVTETEATPVNPVLYDSVCSQGNAILNDIESYKNGSMSADTLSSNLDKYISYIRANNLPADTDISALGETYIVIAKRWKSYLESGDSAYLDEANTMIDHANQLKEILETNKM